MITSTSRNKKNVTPITNPIIMLWRLVEYMYRGSKKNCIIACPSGTTTKMEAKARPTTLAMALDIINWGEIEKTLISAAVLAPPHRFSLVGGAMPILSQY